ncbi:hypothetical protein ATCV1_z200L [Acanthocystis turfacea chlorella virus 1]|uniref:Uncharacterized protein z200L n=1 Tax=Chlorovirus heliozoae TaxID=322019 RepID=A7K8G0_9PHYC|nr:hypothetical protein ATCV1_z200L [Acanthocystis turfacea chlorella virus 1]ABT16334.1 hypothetical protein ATCV1_z200L [Acanthocystis turfacea chlorella virus 1]
MRGFPAIVPRVYLNKIAGISLGVAPRISRIQSSFLTASWMLPMMLCSGTTRFIVIELSFIVVELSVLLCIVSAV